MHYYQTPKSGTPSLPPLRSVEFLDQLRERTRYLHYSIRAEQAYVHWTRQFIRLHGLGHLASLSGSEVEAFLTWLATRHGVAPSTQPVGTTFKKLRILS